MASTYANMRWGIGFMLMLLALLALEGWISARFISQSLVQLNQTAVKLSQGQLQTRAVVKGPIEVENLARALNEMASRLEVSLESLRAFVSNASHELRTPLTSIKLQVGALRGGALEEPDVAQRFLAQIEGEIDRLVRMVNDMLDLSHIEGGFPSANSNEPVNLAELANEVVAFWEARSRQAGLALTLSADPDLPTLKGDTYQLRRLLDNLVDNAINNTPSGGRVAIHVRRCSDEQHVRIEIQDTGQGIHPEHIPFLFNRFYRVTALNKGGRQEGSGLGLAIARSIVVSHGGTIGVNSLPGNGSTFWVELPVL